MLLACSAVLLSGCHKQALPKVEQAVSGKLRLDGVTIVDTHDGRKLGDRREVYLKYSGSIGARAVNFPSGPQVSTGQCTRRSLALWKVEGTCGKLRGLEPVWLLACRS